MVKGNSASNSVPNTNIGTIPIDLLIFDNIKGPSNAKSSATAYITATFINPPNHALFKCVKTYIPAKELINDWKTDMSIVFIVMTSKNLFFKNAFDFLSSMLKYSLKSIASNRNSCFTLTFENKYEDKINANAVTSNVNKYPYIFWVSV